MRIVAILILLLALSCDHRGPKSKSVHVPPDSTWAALRDHLQQGAREGCAIIKVNDAPFYMPCYSPYGDPHERPARIEEPPRILAAGEPVESVESWVASFHLHGALVRIGADVPVSRVTRLVEILDRHRITAAWYSVADPGASITIWQTSIFYIPPPATTNAEPSDAKNGR